MSVLYSKNVCTDTTTTCLVSADDSFFLRHRLSRFCGSKCGQVKPTHKTIPMPSQGMYLKGEGTNTNHTKAVELFELAANEDHVRALNGLGYVYFNGHVLPQNLVRMIGALTAAKLCALARSTDGARESQRRNFTQDRVCSR